MSSIQSTAKPVAAEKSNLLFDSFTYQERLHRDSLDRGRRNVYEWTNRVEVARQYIGKLVPQADSPPEQIFHRANFSARKMDDACSMVYYISIAYWIWSLDVHSTSATSRELALVALYSVGEGEHRLLHPESVICDLERLGRGDPAQLLSYLRGDRTMEHLRKQSQSGIEHSVSSEVSQETTSVNPKPDQGDLPEDSKRVSERMITGEDVRARSGLSLPPYPGTSSGNSTSFSAYGGTSSTEASSSASGPTFAVDARSKDTARGDRVKILIAWSDPEWSRFQPTEVLESMTPEAIEQENESHRLHVEQEMQAIRGTLESPRYRSSYNVRVLPHCTRAEFEQAIPRFAPAIIHFSGHGTIEDLVFEHAEGRPGGAPHYVPKAGLIRTFSQARLNYGLQGLILNACLSAYGAGILTDAAGLSVVTMENEVFDRSAVNFSFEFYKAYSERRTFVNAFHEARAAVNYTHNDIQLALFEP